MNRRRFVGCVMAVGESGYASGEKEFVGFDVDDCIGCSFTFYDHGHKPHHFATLKGFRQVEISEKDFNYLSRELSYVY